MGLYEMVRRRCRRIVLVDATCDPDYGFEDLLNTLRKIRIDMGIGIEFRDGLPGPLRHQCSGRAMAIGSIHYGEADPNADDGLLILIKPTVLPDTPGSPPLPLDVRRYALASSKAKSPFPQQPTSDQFYDEIQFESYRMLGLHTALAVLPDNRWPSLSGPMMGPPESKLIERAQEGSAVNDNGETRLADRLMGQFGEMARTAVVSAITVTGAVTLLAPPPKPPPPATQVPESPASAPRADDTTALMLLAVSQAASDAARELSALSASRGASAVGALAAEATGAASAAQRLAQRLEGVRLVPASGSLTVQLDETSTKAIVVASSNAASAAQQAASAAKTSADAVSNLAAVAADIKQIRNSVAQLPPRVNARGSVDGGQR